jgi:tetratricopeptide (TPR) repeat protein
MKFILILLFSIFFSFGCIGSNLDELINELDAALDNKNEYINQHQQTLQELKDQLHYYSSAGDERKEIDICLELFTKYQSFIYDSAFYYINKAKQKAYALNKPVLISHTKIKEGFVLLSSGLFKEAIDTLKSVKVSILPDTLKVEFYRVMARAFYDLADFGRDPYFMEKHKTDGNLYLDSALELVSKNTSDFWAIESLHRMKSNDLKGAKFALNYWLNNYELTSHQYAIATSTLGYIFSLTGFPQQAKENLARAAINDIKTATMETVALRNLATMLFEQGDAKRAYRYIIEALNDANFYNARHRRNEIINILPIIEGNRLAEVENQKSKLIIFSLLVLILAVLLIVLAIIIYKQLTKLKLIRKTLQETVNNLNEINTRLRDTNQIKEEYIGYFFNANSEYIEKLESFKKNIQRKLMSKQFNQLDNFLNNLNLKKERQELFYRFDEIFLKLFPRFIEKYNSLFPDNEKIELKSGELMNSELRIFALIPVSYTHLTLPTTPYV